MNKERRTMLIGVIIFVAMLITGGLVLDLTNLEGFGIILVSVGALGTLLTFIGFMVNED